MTDIARLPFGSADRPDEQGTLVLSDDGTVRVEPGDALRDALAGREEVGLAQAKTFGTLPGLVLIVLGFCAVAAGWYAGRYFGKYAWRLTAARSVHAVEMLRRDGELQARIGKTMWHLHDCDPQEVELFLEAFTDLKG